MKLLEIATYKMNNNEVDELGIRYLFIKPKGTNIIRYWILKWPLEFGQIYYKG